jgi:hypothetical protein
MGRLKFTHIAEFSNVLERGWDRPVVLQGEAIPEFLDGIPEEARYCFIASGSLQAPLPYRSSLIPEGLRVGGMYVFRHAPDDPVCFNRDDYSIVFSNTEADTLLVDGPFKHPTDHWANEVPAHLQDIEVIGVPEK